MFFNQIFVLQHSVCFNYWHQLHLFIEAVSGRNQQNSLLHCRPVHLTLIEPFPLYHYNSNSNRTHNRFYIITQVYSRHVIIYEHLISVSLLRSLSLSRDYCTNFISNISHLLLFHKRGCGCLINKTTNRKIIAFYLPKSISFRCCHFTVRQYSRGTIAAKIKFYIKPIRLIYRPPDMGCSKWECYWYYFNIGFVKFSR